MTTVTNLGFPRIGAKRELKRALEAYWSGQSSAEALQDTATALRTTHWQLQRDAGVDVPPSNDFSLTFDAMVGGYDTTEDEYDAAAYSASSRSTLETIHEYDETTLSEYGMLVLRDVSYTATQHEFLSKERINKTDYGQYSLALDWNNDLWDIEAMAGYSGAEKTLDYSNLKHVAYAPSRTRWTGRSGETIPSASSAGFDMYGSPERYLFEAYETTLEKINEAFAKAWGSTGYTGNAVYWNVVPRRTPTAASAAPAPRK